jgi:hypothetical protein
MNYIPKKSSSYDAGARLPPIIKYKTVLLHKGGSYDAGARKLVKIVVQRD